jgi:predicted transposase/invertase (TIGR01784 family)
MSRNNYIRFDWAIKRLLRQKSNFVILEGFLSSLLNEKIKINKILESESNQLSEDDKFNRVDLLAENSKDELIIIEVQNNRELDYFHRMAYGVSKAIVEYIDKGDDYAKVRKVYSVNIVYFDLGQGKDYVYHGKTEFRGIHNHDILQLSTSQKTKFLLPDISDIFPEYYVLKVNDFDEKALTPLDEWVSFLKTGDIPDNAKAQGLPEAREILRRDKLSLKEQQQYDAHFEAVRYQRSVIDTHLFLGREEGYKEGIKEGIENGKAEIILNAHKKGFTSAQIADFSGISIDIIEKLLEKS